MYQKKKKGCWLKMNSLYMSSLLLLLMSVPSFGPIACSVFSRLLPLLSGPSLFLPRQAVGLGCQVV